MSAIEMWDAVAPSWEQQAAFVDGHQRATTRRMLALAGIGPGDAVLDLGAGPGGAGLAAAAVVGPSGRVVLSDGSAAMVEVARRRAAGRPNVSTALIDLEAIGAPAEPFDAILCRHALMMIADPVATVRAAAGTLVPGGRLVVSTWASREHNPWLGVLLDVMAEQFGAAFPPPGVPGPFSLDDPQQLTAVLVGGGLADVLVEEVATPMPAASVQDWWERVPALAGPLARVLAALEDDVREQIREQALAAATTVARTTPEGIMLEAAVLVAAGTRPR